MMQKSPAVFWSRMVNSWQELRGWFILVVVLLWCLCTVAQTEKYFGVTRGLLLTVAAGLAVGFVMRWLRGLYARGGDVGAWALPCVVGLLFLSFAFLYPRSLHHEPGGGSDREDALRVELQAVTHGHYPYDARTFRHNPPTPLPGAMWLALPFYAVARVAYQNLVWAIIFSFFLSRFFHKRASSALFALLFLVFALENLNDFVTGGDYLTNVLYMCVATALFARSTDGAASPWQSLGSVVLLGFALSSRALYAITLPPLLAYGIRRSAGRRTAVMMAGALLVSLFVTLPVFLPHPLTRITGQLRQNADKLSYLPHSVPPGLVMAAGLGLSASALLRRRVDLPLVFGVAGAGAGALLLIPMIFVVHAEGGWLAPLTTDLEYLAPAAIFVSLWAFSRWEQDAGPRDLTFRVAG